MLIHGLVERPLVFSIDALSRYPLVSRIQFLECAGNSAGNNAPEPPQQSAGGIHGLLSCSDWTGVPLAILLEEAGLKPEGKWLLAEGADAAGMSRSVPIAKALDDAILALYQNGERKRTSDFDSTGSVSAACAHVLPPSADTSTRRILPSPDHATPEI